MVLTSCDFSYCHYEDVLQQLLAAGYEFLTFQEAGSRKPGDGWYVLLRHDVDKSVKKALDLATIEHRLGLRSTFFVRVHANYYNPFGHQCYLQLKEIAGLGHEIGLHTEFYDAARIAGEDPVRMLQREKLILETVLERGIRTIAAHRTSGSSSEEMIREHMRRLSTDLDSTGDERYHAPGGVKYLSDSSGIWREGCFCQHVGRFPRIHVLTHPEWWFREHIELEEPVV